MAPRPGVWRLIACLVVAPSLASLAAFTPPDPPVEKPDTVRTDLHGDPLPSGAVARLGTIRFRHPGEVQIVVYSPDGKLLATAPHGLTVYLWDAATGKLVRRLETKEGSVRGLTFSADGKTLAIVSCALFIADVESGKVRRVTNEAGPAVAMVACSSDGKTLATRGNGAGIHLWDANTGKELRTLTDAKAVRRLAFSPDGKTLAATGSGVRTWDVGSGELLQRYDPEASYDEIAFAQDGQTLALREYKLGGLTILDLGPGGKRRRVPVEGEVGHWFGFSPDGTLLAVSCGENEAIRLYDAATGKACKDLPPVPAGYELAAWAPKGKVLALVGSFGNAVRLWDVAAGKFKDSADGHDAEVRALAVSPNGKTVASAGNDGTVRLWDSATSKQLWCWNAARGEVVYTVAFAPDGNTLAASKGNKVYFLDPKTGRPRADIRSGESMVYSLAYAPDCRMLYTGGTNLIEAWDLASNKVRRRFGELPAKPTKSGMPPDSVTQVVPFSDGGVLVANGPEGIGVWDTTTGKRRSLPPEIGNVGGRSFTLTPDGRTLAATRFDARLNGLFEDGPPLRLWEVATGQERLKFAADIWDGPSAFSPDGRRLATTNKDGALVLLDVATGRQLGHWKAQEDVGQIAFSSDGKALLTGATDGTILVWDVSALKLADLPGAPKERLQDFWTDLVGNDPTEAYKAVWTLAASKDGAAFLATKLRPVPTPTADVLDRLFADLDSNEYIKREAASAALAKFQDGAAPAMRKLLQSDPSPEVKRRLQGLLARLDQPDDPPSRERLRTLRGVEALERAGNAPARELLKELSQGAPGAWLTQDAKASLERLERLR